MLCFSFFRRVEFDYLVVFIIFFGAVIIFSMLYRNPPFVNSLIKVQWRVLAAYILWSASCLLSAKVGNKLTKINYFPD